MHPRRNHHSHPPPSHPQDKLPDAGPPLGKRMPAPCISGRCDECLPKVVQALASSRLPQRWLGAAAHPCGCGSHGGSRSTPSPAAHCSDDRIIHCMLCDTSGHDHGTVRLIFEPLWPFCYRQGQILRVLLPGSCGPEILITSLPSDAAVMHGKLLLPSGAALPAQFGPDAAFGLMFQVCADHKIRSS